MNFPASKLTVSRKFRASSRKRRFAEGHYSGNSDDSLQPGKGGRVFDVCFAIPGFFFILL